MSKGVLIIVATIALFAAGAAAWRVSPFYEERMAARLGSGGDELMHRAELARKAKLEGLRLQKKRHDESVRIQWAHGAGPPPCPASTRSCLNAFVKEKLDANDVEKILAEFQGCLSNEQNEQQERASQGACLPLSLGIDARNQQELRAIFVCGDDCVRPGQVKIYYPNLAEWQCCAHGAVPSPAFGTALANCYPRRPSETLPPRPPDPCSEEQIRTECERGGPRCPRYPAANLEGK